MEQILASHSQVVGAGELRDLWQLLSSHSHKRDLGGDLGSLCDMPDQDLKTIAEKYLGSLAKFTNSQTIRVVDKVPHNFLYLGVIALLFPRARVIHCRRDPLDVCLSCYFQDFKEVNYASSLEDLGLYYREYQRLMTHWRNVLPLRLLDIHYENLVANQEATSRELVAFCGLQWEDRCLAFHKNPRPVQTLSAVQVRRPIYNNAVGRWKKYAAYLERVRKALGPLCPIRGDAANVRLVKEDSSSLSQAPAETDRP